MALVTTVKGRFHSLVSDATGATDICSELMTAMAAQGVGIQNIIEFDIVSKTVVFGK